jgi:hypothetical protein
MELRVVGKGTASLYNILIYSGQQHMHGIDIGFGEDRGGSGNDWGNEDLMSLVQLVDMTSFSIPVYIADHTGAPKVLTGVCFGSVEGFVTK